MKSSHNKYTSSLHFKQNWGCHLTKIKTRQGQEYFLTAPFWKSHGSHLVRAKAAFQSHELDETLKRLGQHGGVLGTIVVNAEGELRLTLWRWKCQDWSRVPCPGIAVKTTLDAAQTVQYTALISGITKQVRPSDSTIDGWLLCFVLCVCVKSCISGPGHGAKYRPGQWPDIPETEVLQIFATLAADHGLNVLFQGQRRTRFWSHQVGVVKFQSVGVGNISADRDYILIVVQLAADHLLNTADQAREGWTVNSSVNR